MNKIKRYLLWGGLLVGVSCSDFSKICRHGFNNANGFVFVSAVKHADASLFRYTAGRNEPGTSPEMPVDMPTEIDWEMLAGVTFRRKFNKDYQMDFLYPVFGFNVKRLNNKELVIAGFMIPLDIKEGLYAISRNPYAACFFCGQSGPESVVSLKFKTKPRRFKTDEYLTVKGTMELNDADVNDFIYIFRGAEEVK